MTARTVIRWSGLLGILAALLLVVSFFAMSQRLLAVAAPLVILTLGAIYASQVEETGALGLIGLLLLYFALMVYSSFAFFQGYMMPALSPEAMGAVFGSLEPLLFGTGAVNALAHIVFGLAILQADVLPRWGAILFIVGGVPNGFPPLIPQPIYAASIVILAAGIAWLSYGLWAAGGAVDSVGDTAPSPS